MLFLVVFSTLAIGFYAACTTATQTAANDEHVAHAQNAAESGMAFARYQLSRFVVPASTTQGQLLSTAATALSQQLNGTRNLGAMTVGFPSGGSVINVPSLSYQHIPIGDGSASFRADVTQSGSQLVVKSTGCYGAAGVTRAIQLNFAVVQNSGTIFNYGLAAKGAVTLSGGILQGVPDASRGSFLSTTLATNTPLTMSGSANVSGQVYFTNPNGSVSGNGSISGTTNPALWPNYVHKNVTAPEFPAVDPTPYANYLATVTPTIITGSTSATPLSNIRIKAGANPTFSGGPTINGLIYIEAPNKVSFSGGAHITGVIVVDDPNESTSTNAIVFSGASTISGPENLPTSYGALRTMTGASVLAPNFAVSLSGGSSTFGGSVLAKSLSMSGGSGGSVNGSAIIYGTASSTFSGGSGFTFTNTGPAAIPTAGVHFSGYFAPVAASYAEVSP
jgi:hypothetical protein